VQTVAPVLQMMQSTLYVNIQVVMATEGLDSSFFSRSLVEGILRLVLRQPSCLPQFPPLMDVRGLAALPEAR
jgi:hypothetical protein